MMELLVLVTLDCDPDKRPTPAKAAEALIFSLQGETILHYGSVVVDEVEVMAAGEKVISVDQVHFDRVIDAAQRRADNLRRFAHRSQGRASERAMSAMEANHIEESIAEVKGEEEES